MTPPKRASVNIVIPVLNEAHVLERSITKVHEFLSCGFPYDWSITIVDNGSSDGTDRVAFDLTRRYPEVSFLHLEQRGRGRALRFAWQNSRADVCCYMDVDLSTDLSHLEPLVRAIAVDGYAVSTGSRLMPASQVKRSVKREFISRAYNLFLRIALDTGVSDAQCGFKGVSRAVVDQIVPLIEDQAWFFDTELLALTVAAGLRVKEIPVAWTEDDDSRVKIVKTAWDDIKGVSRVRRQLRDPKMQRNRSSSSLKTPPES